MNANWKLSKRLLLQLILLCCSIYVSAYDFEVDGICYNILSDSNNEVEVTSKKNQYGTNLYSGDISIPSEVVFGGNKYTVTIIGGIAFYGCGHKIKSVTLPNTIRNIGSGSFKSLWDIKSIVLPSSLITIGNQAFCDCQSLESIDIPENVTSIGDEAFDYCLSLKSVTLGNSLKTINNSTFSRCGKLTSLNIPNSVETIGVGAFSECTNLKTVILPQNLSVIEERSFSECKSLESIIIPKTVKSIGNFAFENCSAADTIISRIEEPFEIPTYVFHSLGYNSQPIKHSVLLVPYGSKSKYQQHIGWYNCFTKVEEELPNYSFTIKSSGNGCVSCDGNTIRNDNCTFPVNAGETISIMFTPDDGYRIKSIIVDNMDVTSNISNNTYTISNISGDTTIEVEFEAIPTCTLTISAFGNGSAIFKEASIRNETKSFTVLLGNSYSVHPQTDAGYELKTVKLYEDGVFVRSGLPAYDYHIDNISIDTRLEFEFSTNYTLSIKVKGNGFVSYNGTKIENDTSSFSIKEGKSATLTLTPDAGYRIKSVMVNNADVTSTVTNNSYTITSISGDISVEVEFEAIPLTTYTLSIKAIGNGSASYNGNTIKNQTSTFTVNEGTLAIVLFNPDSGYRIKSVKVNNADVTSSVSNNSYTISSISANTTLEVEFEAIPPTTYALTIKATGGGSASYNGTVIRSKTSTFTVNEGTSATISFSPDNGYRIKSVKVNNTDVTSSISNNLYTLSNIIANTTLEVEFESIPITTYTLSITATGNGSASYNGTTIRNKTSSFTVNEGTSATITFSPDNGYRIKSVKLNSADITSSVSGNQYTINNISANTTLEVEFEAIPAMTYTLSIKVTGNGSASYNGTTIRSKTSSFTVNEGTSVSISITPDNGYRIKSVKENNTNVTSYVSNGTYAINNISRNTTIEVEFEAIPATTYTLSIKATGNGYVSYNGITTRNETNSFTVNEGDNALLSFIPESGYRLASVRVNDSDVTYWVYDNQYTISNISFNTTVEVTFEVIPVPTYSLSITASGNGSATYNGSTIRNRTTSFTVDEGTSATITFTPDNGNSIASVKLNYSDITSQISGNSYTISNITANTTLSVTFQEDVNALTVDGLNYTVTSQSNKTVRLTSGGSGLVLTVPATITQNGITWKVTGIDKDALKGNAELAAIIWNPEAAFAATVSNPNLLLYVKSSDYAPATIQNVVVNGTASNIVLTEAKSGNNFYCPQSFVAQKISFTHNYQMQTGIGESRGWETIALPFDVQTITHATKGTIKPFANWKSGDTAKPFWLMELTGTDFVETGNIKAYTPYIISMPNNPQYDNQWLLNGKVTFAASGVTVGKTDQLQEVTYKDRTFVPNYVEKGTAGGFYALNVSNDYETNNSGMTDGSRFVLNMRAVHPFEAYMTTASNAAPYIDVFDDMSTGIHLMVNGNWTKEEVIYDLQGRKLNNPSKKGVYIINGKKKVIK